MTKKPPEGEEYDPKTYWNSRARGSMGNPYQAVCVKQKSDSLNRAAGNVQRHFLGRVTDMIDLGDRRVMEFGCGVGRWVDFFQSRGCEFTGVDISAEMLEIGSAKYPGIDFRRIDGKRLPFDDGQFDLVYSLTVLHHNPFDTQAEIVREMIRVVRPGGCLLLMEDIAHGGTRRSGFNMFLRTSEDWKELVEKEPGMRTVDVAFIRWWILASGGERFLQLLYRLVMRRPLDDVARSGSYGRMVDSVVAVLNRADIFLQRFLPRRYAVNAAMLFRKSDAGS